MSFLLDTNVISEWVKPRPDPHVVAWLADTDEDRTFLSAISFAEIRLGIELLPEGLRRRQLALWLAEDLTARFEGRILPVDLPVARKCAALHVPDPLEDRDSLIAATALVHGMTVVTRNTVHFQRTGVALLNPWQH